MALVLTCLVFPESGNAQDLEPRRWSHLPTGQNIVGLGYSYTEANIYFSAFWKITDGTARLDSMGVSTVRTFDLAGKSARFSLLLPYVDGRWEGNVDGQYQVLHQRGMGDPRIRFSVNLYGAPALKGEAFRQYRAEHTTNTVVGASVAFTLPLGRYLDDELINIGNNRWSARPQVGVVHTRDRWSFELTASAILFTDNDSFVDNAVLKQNTLYTAQAHAIYTFKPGVWAGLSTGYGAGGRVFVDRLKTAFEVDNWVWAAGLGFPVGGNQSVKLTWLSGRTQNQVGRDSDNLVLSWSMRWEN